MNKQNKLDRLCYYINWFFAFAVFGYFFETTVQLFRGSNWSSGILYGPITPIYGWGIIIIILVFKLVKKFNLKKWLEVIVLFIFLIITITILEQLGGMLIESLFDIVYWNYERYRFNWGPYVALEISLVWGILSLFVGYFIVPKVSPLIKKIPKFITIILIIAFIINIILTYIAMR